MTWRQKEKGKERKDKEKAGGEMRKRSEGITGNDSLHGFVDGLI